MSDHDCVVQTIDAIYESGVDSGRMPAALESTSHLLNAVGAVFFEVADIATLMPTEFWSFGMPALKDSPNVEHFMSLNPRIRFAFLESKEQLIWDYQFIDEDRIKRHPFYAEFLTSLGLRYSLAAILERSADNHVVISVQRSREQGHVDEREIALMKTLIPHFRRAHDMTMRLKTVGIRRGFLENTLDWLNDGVALLQSDGRIIYANQAFCRLERLGDAFRVANDIVEFFSPEARTRFGAAFRVVSCICGDLVSDVRPLEFFASRVGGSPAYTVALRPVIHGQDCALQHADAAVMMFVHDPLARNVAAIRMLAELFNLTGAEANLAQALCAGMTTGAYASTRRVSLNTVYTHLRRLREKTQCNSVAELVRKFGEFNVPLRMGRAPLKNQLGSPEPQLDMPVSTIKFSQRSVTGAS